MSTLTVFAGALLEVLKLMVRFWKITFPFVAFAVVSLVMTVRRMEPGTLARSGWVFLPILLPVLSCGWAAVFIRAAAESSSPTWHLVGLQILLFAHLPLGIVIVWRLKGLRWFATSISLLSLWASLLATFLGGMMITWDWV